MYQNVMEAAMRIFELTKAFPQEEKYSMVDQEYGRSKDATRAGYGQACIT